MNLSVLHWERNSQCKTDTAGSGLEMSPRRGDTGGFSLTSIGLKGVGIFVMNPIGIKLR